MHLNQLTLTEASEGLQQKKFSSEELVRDCLFAIEKQDKKLHAFLTIDADGAIAAAKDVDMHRKHHAKLDPLAGIPIAVKDIIATKGMRTTAASKMLEHYMSPYDATVVARLKERGMVLLGKTNLDEFAHGASTENSAFGPTKNPWDRTRVPGGSSGGSAAAVASNECIAALGSDTGGSIRQPASFTGIVGLKPTYGRVSRYGLLSMTSSTDVIGPMTKTVRDAALLFDAIAGYDPHDATSSAAAPLASLTAQSGDIAGLTVGIPKEYFGDGIEDAVRVAVEAAIDQLRSLGARIVQCSLPHTASAVPVYYIITPSEVSANLARYDGIRYGHSAISNAQFPISKLDDAYAFSRAHGFGDEAKRRIMLGTYALSAGYYDAFYVKASQVRTLIADDFDEVFKTVDIILTPTSPHVAFKLGEKANDPLQLYLEDIFVNAVSLAGLPAISIPCGFSRNGKKKLPIGMQLVGKHNAEDAILRAAYAYERATSWHTEHPLSS